MPRFNTNCVICEDKFISSDIIHSTYCGHIFHKNCLDTWKSWKASCPICQREFLSETFGHQLFLEVDNEIEISQKNEVIKASETEAQDTKKRDLWLQDQMREMKINFRLLQEQLTASEQSKNELKEEIKNLKQRVQGSRQKSSIENKDETTTELEDLKNVEITERNTNSSGSNGDDIASSDSALKSQIRILEQKVKHLSGELEKEIAISTKLYIEKFQKEYVDLETDNYILIEDFPKRKLLYPLENTVILVGAKIHLDVSPEDIHKVRMLEKDERGEEHEEDAEDAENAENAEDAEDAEDIEYEEDEGDEGDEELIADVVTLLVEFKSNHMKVKFLANKDVLQCYLSRLYTIKPLQNDIYSLLVYTNEKLKNCGGFINLKLYVDRVHQKNDCITARDKEGQTFKIFSRLEADMLLKRYIQDQAFDALIAKRFTKA